MIEDDLTGALAVTIEYDAPGTEYDEVYDYSLTVTVMPLAANKSHAIHAEIWHPGRPARATTMKRHFSMIREFHLADWFTLANAFCGAGAIFAAMRFLQDGRPDDLLRGMALIPLAFLFDALDGRIARWRHKSSVLGRELDSLADVISFGMAPAALAYACGMQGGWDWIVLSYFVCCGVSRLARYNVTAESLSGDDGKVRHFEGTPIPTSLVLVVVLAFATWHGHIGGSLWFGVIDLGWQLHPLVLMFALSGSLMISKTLHIPKP